MKKKNICIVVSTLGLGGAEKVAALQTKMLLSLGYNVCVLSISRFEGGVFDFHGDVSVLEDIGFDNSMPIRVAKRLSFLNKYLKDKRIDLIIDHRSRMNFFREVLLNWFFYKVKTIFMIHSKDMVRDGFFENPLVRSKIVFNWLYKNYSIVSLSLDIYNAVLKSFFLLCSQ